MPKQSKLRRFKKRGQTYWVSVIRGKKCYFGNVADVSFEDAKTEFAKKLGEPSAAPTHGVITATELADRHVIWHMPRHGDRYSRRRHLELFCVHEFDGVKLGDLPAARINATHLESFMDAMRTKTKEDGSPWYAPDTLWHMQVNIKAAWNWGAGTKEFSGGIFPPNHRPFANVKNPDIPPPELTEVDLITPDEIDEMLDGAIKYNAEDIIKVLHGTGARPDELCKADVKHFVASAQQIVLAKHKNARKTKRARRIFLNTESVKIVERLCDGRQPDDPIFCGPLGARWTRNRLGKIWRKIRKKKKLRDILTLYSLRHLWISDMLLARQPIAKVAKMAGTSVRMIEKTYGHFYDEDIHAAHEQLDAIRAKRKNKRAG